jgi:hypothetical protein
MDEASARADRPPLAYLVVSHTLPRQVLRLMSVLRRASPRALLLSHHDDRTSQLDRAALDALDVVRIEPPSPVAWGEFAQLAMILRCLRFAVAQADFDWLVLLSGQDYPVRPVAEIERSLALADVDAFAETRACERPPLAAIPDEFAARYFFRWRPLSRRAPTRLVRAAGLRGRLVRLRAMPTGTWVGVRALRSPFGSAFGCYRGGDWLTLSRAAVEAVQRFAADRPDVVGYYAHTLHPNESFIQTVLANDASLRLSGDTRRINVWDRPHMSGPRVLTMDDLERVLGSGADFARKFDETVDRAVLDELDRRVHAPRS